MASCTEVIGSIDEITDFNFFLYFVHNIQRFFISIRVSDTDNLFFRLYNIIANQIDQCI